MKYVAPLTEVEIQTLQEMHRYHPSRRARMRAHSLLLSHQGIAMPQIARIYQVDYRSVSSWINQWQTRGLVGLYDQPGAGRRPILSLDEQQKVHQSLQDSPKDLKKVVHQLEQETGKRVSPKTIKRLMKKNRYVWKRSRKAPAKAPDPHKYARSKVFRNQLQQRAAGGECALWYFDGTGFCLTPCIPYAGQPIGHTIELPASSHNQRVNVLALQRHFSALTTFPHGASRHSGCKRQRAMVLYAPVTLGDRSACSARVAVGLKAPASRRGRVWPAVRLVPQCCE